MLQAKELVEQAYNASGGLPVYLMGHSNGPLYLLALMNTTTPQWRQQYVGELSCVHGTDIGGSAACLPVGGAHLCA